MNYSHSPTYFDQVLGLLRDAPEKRRTRRWHRRRLLVLWRVYPGRFQLLEEVTKALKRSGQKRTGVGGGDERIDSAAGVLAARVAGLEEEDIFRSIVMLL